MINRFTATTLIMSVVAAFTIALAAGSSAQVSDPGHQQQSLDAILGQELAQAGFTGRIEESLVTGSDARSTPASRTSGASSSSTS